MGLIPGKATRRRSSAGLLMADIFGLICLTLVLHVDLERASTLELRQTRVSPDAAETEPFAATFSVGPDGIYRLASRDGNPDGRRVTFDEAVAAIRKVPDARRIQLCADRALPWGDVRDLTTRLEQVLDMAVWQCPRQGGDR